MNAALWLRVSTDDQHAANQAPALRRLARQHKARIVKVYQLDGASAFKGEHRELLDQALADAHRGEYQRLYVWSLDRLDRESAIGPFLLLRRFRQAGVDVVSQAEPWVAMDGPFADLIVLLVGWFANFESVRRSERTRAGLARRKAEGKPIGRQPGAVDKGKRRRSGYVARYEK